MQRVRIKHKKYDATYLVVKRQRIGQQHSESIDSGWIARKGVDGMNSGVCEQVRWKELVILLTFCEIRERDGIGYGKKSVVRDAVCDVLIS
jgi:hypothetical protein